MKKFWEDFKKFIKRGNVVDMAVGVAVASAFTAIVTAFTNGFINPLLALISKDSNQEALKWVLRPEKLGLDEAGNTIVLQTEVAILWGPFVQAIINFLVVAFFLFLVMRIASRLSARALQIGTEIKDLLTDDDENKAAAEAEAALAAEEAAKAEAEAAAEAERKAAEEAARLQAEKEEAQNRLLREEALLVEIRDLLKELKK